MFKFVVTGANGFVGRALCADLVNRGHFVRAVVRTNANFEVSGCEIFRVPQITLDTDWTGAFEGFTTVIHLAARVHIMRDNAHDPLEEFRKTNVAATEHLARAAAAGGVTRLVYVSSVKVNGELTQGNDSFSESGVPFPQDPYGVSKWEAEQALHRVAAETGLEIVIVRPPLVYGPDVKGNFSQMLMALRSRIPLPLASVNNLRSLIYVGNLIDALILCATHPAAAGKTYLVSDDEDISTSDLLRELGDAMGCPARLLSCSPALLQFGGRLLGKSDQLERLLGSLRIDSSKIRRELGWAPPYSLRQGLLATVT